MDTKPIDHDPLTGIKEDYHYDQADGRIVLSHTQDTRAIVEEAKRMRAAAPGWKSDFVHVAKLSLVHCLELQQLGIMVNWGIKDEAAFQVWLNNHPDFKTTEGRF